MDKREQYAARLTPSAKAALNEIGKELTNQILDDAYMLAQTRSTGDYEISLGDILEAKQLLVENKNEFERIEARRRRWTNMISLSGTLYIMAGFAIYLWQSEKFSLNTDWGLIVSGIGIISIVFGMFYTQVLFKKNTQAFEIGERLLGNSIDYEIVERWHVIERLTSTIMKQNGFNDNKSTSVSSIFDFLSTHLPEDNITKLRQLLQIRNKILHQSYRPSRTEKSDLISFSNQIIKNLDAMNKSSIK